MSAPESGAAMPWRWTDEVGWIALTLSLVDLGLVFGLMRWCA